MSLQKCKIINLQKIEDQRGNLSFIESNKDIPFEIARVYYLYDVPGGSNRGSHAHKKLHQFIVATSGSFDVEVDNGQEKKRFHLNRPYFGLYLAPLTWRYIDNFSSGAVCMVLASEHYNEEDYIRNYEYFKSLVESIK